MSRIEIIPAILEKEIGGVAAKIQRIEKEAPAIKLVQIDIMDGKFVPNITSIKPEDLYRLSTRRLKFELHLMVESPREYIDEWTLDERVAKVLFHREAVDDSTLVKSMVALKERNVEGGIVLNPNTSLDAIKEHVPIIDEVMFMGVYPGFSGQSFVPEVFNKIKAFHAFYPDKSIAVDGGINQKTAPLLIAAGATRLCAASYLWESKDLKEAVESLAVYDLK